TAAPDAPRTSRQGRPISSSRVRQSKSSSAAFTRTTGQSGLVNDTIMLGWTLTSKLRRTNPAAFAQFTASPRVPTSVISHFPGPEFGFGFHSGQLRLSTKLNNTAANGVLCADAELAHRVARVRWAAAAVFRPRGAGVGISTRHVRDRGTDSRQEGKATGGTADVAIVKKSDFVIGCKHGAGSRGHDVQAKSHARCHAGSTGIRKPDDESGHHAQTNVHA